MNSSPKGFVLFRNTQAILRKRGQIFHLGTGMSKNSFFNMINIFKIYAFILRRANTFIIIDLLH